MSKHNKKQFDDLLNQATAQMKNEIAKREVIHFRINEHSLKQLQDLALKQKLHVGALVREWVLERLTAEQNPVEYKKPARSPKNTDLRFMAAQLENDLDRMRQHIATLKTSAS